MTCVDREAPLRFLRTAYQPDDWIAVFVKSYESGHTTQRVGPLSLVSAARFQAWLRWRNVLHGNIYVSVNAIEPNQHARTRNAVAGIRHLFLDVDNDGSVTLAAIAARKDMPPPSYVLESSPRRMHVLWRVSGFTVAGVEALQKQLARELGTDRAATACTQMTRLPGFTNYKRSPHVVSVEYRDVAAVYRPLDFPSPAETRTGQRGDRPVASLRKGLDAVERARRYMTSTPPAIAGQHGDVHTFRVCCRLIRGFALTDDEAFELLIEWNTRCEPPWSERELREKLRRGRRYGREALGGLLNGRDG